MAIKREWIGDDVEESVMTGNRTVASSRNIKGTNSVIITNGVPTMDISPVKVDSTKNFSKYLVLADFLSWETDKLKRDFTVIYDFMLYGADLTTAKPLAFVETADVEVTGIAEGNEAMQNSATLHWNGNRTYYEYDDSGASPILIEITDFDETKIQWEPGIATRKQYQLWFNYDEAEFN